jgi:hypothetical protein
VEVQRNPNLQTCDGSQHPSIALQTKPLQQ